jgi:hypothetical protein
MGPDTVQMLDEFDAQDDTKAVQQRLAPRGDAASGAGAIRPHSQGSDVQGGCSHL